MFQLPTSGDVLAPAHAPRRAREARDTAGMGTIMVLAAQAERGCGQSRPYT
jgi:hypothetical protein